MTNQPMGLDVDIVCASTEFPVRTRGALVVSIDARRLRANSRMEQDIRLIAAAPDLLAALHRLAPYLENDEGGAEDWNEAIGLARKAIAAAEGRP